MKRKVANDSVDYGCNQAWFCNDCSGVDDGSNHRNSGSNSTNDASAIGASWNSNSANLVRNPPSELPLPEAQAGLALAKELNALSISERQKVYEDIHGIADLIEETPEMIQVAMQTVDAELRKCHDARKKIYSRATFLRPAYFHSQQFVLDFLRAENFHPKKAAQRILDHFSMKFDLFGIGALCSTYIHHDTHLTEGTEHYLATARAQLLPKPDRSGRPVFVVFPKLQGTGYAPIDGIRAYWWIFDIARHQFPLATKRGLVMILYDSQIVVNSRQEEIMKQHYFDESGSKAAARFLQSQSVTLSAIHFCFDNPEMAAPMRTFQNVIGRHGRVRFRTHCASPTECMYTLMTFGIDTRDFPVNKNNSVIIEPFYKWIEDRRKLEQDERKQAEYCVEGSDEGQVTTFVMFPKANDVILGRGKPFQEHPGNLRLAAIVNGYWETYQTCDWKEKMELTIQIVEEIKSGGNRFFTKYDSGKHATQSIDDRFQWITVGDSKARAKISHSFRNTTVQRTKESKADASQVLPASAAVITPPIITHEPIMPRPSRESTASTHAHPEASETNSVVTPIEDLDYITDLPDIDTADIFELEASLESVNASDFWDFE